jgi:hypothetical protein
MIGLQSEGVDLVALRAKLAAMTEAELLAFGKGMHTSVYPRTYGLKGLPTVSAFSIQLDEARAEWRRRHAKT